MPYIEIRTSKGPLKFLVDTGANKNYISPEHVNDRKCKPTLLKVTNLRGKHEIRRYVNFNPIPKIHRDSPKFYVFQFHSFFDGLIGYETLLPSSANFNHHQS